MSPERNRVVLRVLAAGMSLAAACAPGSSYDDLSGGTRDEPAIDPPRPTFPVSVSALATLRPKLRWELAPATSGAVVEMCRTRDCATVAKTWDAPGAELVVPEDLEPGFWFWRLRSTKGNVRGTRTSPTWELVLRGPAAAGSSDVPSGAVGDLDGDGRADLATVGNGTGGTTVIVFLGTDAGFSLQQLRTAVLDDETNAVLSDPKRPIALAGGVDLEGQGFAVLLDSTFGYPSANRGGPNTLNDPNDYFDLFPAAVGGVTAEQANLPAGYALLPDFDGDGYGDVLVVDGSGARVQLGRRRGQGPIVPFPTGAKQGPALAADLDADGFTDAVVPTEGDAPATVQLGDRNGFPSRSVVLRVPVPGTRAVAMTSGDLDGDGVADAVFVLVAPTGVSQLCVFPGDRARVVRDPVCAAPPPGALAFAEQVVAGDLEPDGRDDLLVSVTTASGRAIVSVKLDGAALAFGATIGAGTGTSLAAIWPGRPGRARWAATAESGDRIDVYEGLEPKQQLPRPPDVTAGFGRVLQ